MRGAHANNVRFAPAGVARRVLPAVQQCGAGRVVHLASSCVGGGCARLQSCPGSDFREQYRRYVLLQACFCTLARGLVPYSPLGALQISNRVYGL